jgi:hypothetical protein
VIENTYTVQITTPKGQKLPTFEVDPAAFSLNSSREVGNAIGATAGRLIERHSKR